jgi:hypothetical protein
VDPVSVKATSMRAFTSRATEQAAREIASGTVTPLPAGDDCGE